MRKWFKKKVVDTSKAVEYVRLSQSFVDDEDSSITWNEPYVAILYEDDKGRRSVRFTGPNSILSRQLWLTNDWYLFCIVPWVEGILDFDRETKQFHYKGQKPEKKEAVILSIVKDEDK